MNLPSIIHEDSNILVINKPTGLVVHPFDYSTEKTLLDFLKSHSPEIFSIDNSVILQDRRVIKLGGIVHKLDRDTTGIMVIAKKQDVFNELHQQFINNTVVKTYLALVEGTVTDDSILIEVPLGRSKKNYKQKANPSKPRGELRPAVTEVKVIARNVHELLSSTFVELTPRTEKAHQLRAHMSHIGHPIVGDKVYGSKRTSLRIMIHAKALTFSVRGKLVSFSTNDDFIKKMI